MTLKYFFEKMKAKKSADDKNMEKKILVCKELSQYLGITLNQELLLMPRGYKTFFMLNSTENEISTAHKTKLMKIIDFSCFKTLRCCIYHANKC